MSKPRIHPGPSEAAEQYTLQDDQEVMAKYILQIATEITVKKKFYREWFRKVDEDKIQELLDALEYAMSRLSQMYGISHAADSLIERMQVCDEMLRSEYERFESYAEWTSPSNYAEEKEVYFDAIVMEACDQLDTSRNNTWFAFQFTTRIESILQRDFDHRSLINQLRRQLYSLRELMLQNEERVEQEELDRCVEALHTLQRNAYALDREAQLFTERNRPDSRNS